MKLRSRGACLGGAQRELVQAAPLRVIQAAEQPRLKSDQHVAKQPHPVDMLVYAKTTHFCMQGSYHGGNTASRPISEVKQR